MKRSHTTYKKQFFEVETISTHSLNNLFIRMQFIFLDLTELGIDYIDVVVLSIPPFLDAETQISIIRPMWRVCILSFFVFIKILLTLTYILKIVSKLFRSWKN